MKEHPILFSSPMVLALLADRKTVTRRMSKLWLKVKAGDRLWVKETHWRYGKWRKDGFTKTGRQRWRFVATHGHNTDTHPEQYVRFEKPDAVPSARTELGWHKRPSLFLPRWASRITLEATEDAREERLQDLTCEDVMGEGSPIPMRQYSSAMGLRCDSARRWFQDLWSTLHTKLGERWEDNPSVVRIAFRRVA